MRILIISALFPPEPVVSASISFDLAEELSKDHTVTVLCPTPTRPLGYKFATSKSMESCFKRIELASFTYPESRIIGRFWESYSFGKHCAAYIKKNANSIDVIYFNAWPLFSQFMIAYTAKKYRIPYVIHMQDIYPETVLNPKKIISRIPYYFFLQVDRYVLKNAKMVVTISDHMCRYVKSTRNLKNEAEVVYNWQDQQLISNENSPNKPGSKFVFMFLGSLSPTAGIDVLIRGFCKADIPGTKLVLAGAGTEKSNLEKIASNYQGQDIQFVEARKEQVSKLQQSADVLLLSLKKGSAGYALPSKLTSYFFSQKPVIAFVDKGSAVGELIGEASCGWVCDLNDAAKIAETFSIAKEATDETRNEMGNKGRAFAEQKLSRSVNLLKLKKIILSN